MKTGTLFFYLAGVLCGVLLFVLLYVASRKNKEENRYDERQMISRGRAYRNGFFTLIVTQLLVSCADAFSVLPGEAIVWHIGAIFAGMLIFVLTAIHGDAYVGLRDNPRQIYISGLVLTAAIGFNAFNRFSEAASHSDPDDRAVAWICTMAAAVWVILLTALFIHNRRAKNDEERSDDE